MCHSRHRAQLVRLRTLLRNRIHAVLADHGHGRPEGCWSGPGRAWLASLELPAVSREVIEDGLALIDALQEPIDRLDWEVHQRARSEPAVKVLTQLPGIGPFTALVLLAEIGDISRFGSARKLAAWAGLASPVTSRAWAPGTGTPTMSGPVVHRRHRPCRWRDRECCPARGETSCRKAVTVVKGHG